MRQKHIKAHSDTLDGRMSGRGGEGMEGHCQLLPGW